MAGRFSHILYAKSASLQMRAPDAQNRYPTCDPRAMRAAGRGSQMAAAEERVQAQAQHGCGPRGPPACGLAGELGSSSARALHSPSHITCGLGLCSRYLAIPLFLLTQGSRRASLESQLSLRRERDRREEHLEPGRRPVERMRAATGLRCAPWLGRGGRGRRNGPGIEGGWLGTGGRGGACGGMMRTRGVQWPWEAEHYRRKERKLHPARMTDAAVEKMKLVLAPISQRTSAWRLWSPWRFSTEAEF